MQKIRVGVGLAWAAVIVCYPNIGLRLEVATVSLDAEIELRVLGLSGLDTVLEISTDLMNWGPLAVLTLENGEARYSHKAPSDSPTLFYRAIVESELPGLGVQADPNFSVTGLVTENGAKLSLPMPDGRDIALEVPPGCVLQPEIITLTLVTNLVGLPFASGTIGAVRMKPERLRFFGAASLQIPYPEGTDRRKITSFAVGNDGGHFGLALGRAKSNHVLIPITQLGLYGASLTTTQELARLAEPAEQARTASHPQEANCPGLPCWGDNLREEIPAPEACYICFPDLYSRALARRCELQYALDAIKCEVSRLLAIERQNQLLGTADDSNQTTMDLLARMCPFYKESIVPVWKEAENNCALGIVLNQFTLSFIREVALMGAEEEVPCLPSLSEMTENACTHVADCLRQMKLCCERGHRGVGNYREMINIARQFILAGKECLGNVITLDNKEVHEVFRACLTNAWIGTLKVTQNSEWSTNLLNGTLKTKYSEKYTSLNPTFATGGYHRTQVVENQGRLGEGL